MARWRLLEPHHLNVPGTEWEYKEQDQVSGKQVRRVFPVPLLLDPRDASDHNYPGEIIVSDGNGAQPRDIIFAGDPTPGMEPLDEAAEKISAARAPSWQHPVDSLPGTFSQSLIENFEKQMLAPTKAASGVSASEFEALKAQVAALVAENADLQAKAERRRA